MGTRIFYSIKTQFDFVNNDLFYDYLYRIVSFFWSFVSSYSFYLLGLLSRHVFRYEEGENLGNCESYSNEVRHKQDDDSICCSDSEIDQSKRESSVVMQPELSARANKYEFLSGKDISGFVEEPKTWKFTIHELILNSKNDDSIMDPPIFDTEGNAVEDLRQADKTEEEEVFVKTDDDVLQKEEEEEEEGEEERKIVEEIEEELVFDDAQVVSGDHEFDAEETEDSVKSLVLEDVTEKQEMGKLKEKDDLDHKKDSSNKVFHEKINTNDSTANKISVIGFFDQGSEPETPLSINEEKAEDTTELETSDSEDEYIELQPQKQNSIIFDEEKQEQNESVNEASEKSEEFSKFEVENDTDYMFQHQDIVEQLKMELKLARTGGLPTILEESETEELETPKAVQELKPMKIDEQKLDYKQFLEGIQKVYRNYADKMRKLDILNFQTMHAVGLLEMKGTAELEAARKSSVTGIMSIISQNLRLCKGSEVIDPIKKVIADVHRDFETIYIGQLCLSWEILRWQYQKAQELHNYESEGCHQYNQVAGEFQLFQVLIHRFLENEQFQGPTRIQNYVKNRCVLRSLLQVPLLKDDTSEDKGKKGNDTDEDAITSQVLTDIIKQSMKVFWEFLRSDKEESNMNMIFQSHMHSHSHSNLQELVDLELLTDIRADFQKKEKKLKDILRSGNCIVKRLKKQKGSGIDQALLIAQVELKLVSRVLNMSKLTTDKLIWCHEKLDKINFCSRQVSVESSVLLFPC